MDQQSAIEEIALIKRVIDESREFAFNIGMQITVWGILISIAVFASYGAIMLGYGHLAIWFWVVMIGTGWIFSLVKQMRDRAMTESLGAKIVTYVWRSCGIAMTILGFAGILSHAVQDWSIAPILATIIGIGFAVTALIQRFKWVMSVAAAWWFGSLLMFLVRSYQALPIFGIMMILFMVVPGMVFHRQWKNKQISIETK